MAEYPYYDEDPRRNAKRRRRRYEDDAWGQAEYADYADGDFAAAEDYAGGMVDEVGYHRRNYDRDNNDYYGQEGDYTTAATPASDNWRSQHISARSNSVERASELLARLNKRNSVRGTVRPAAPERQKLVPPHPNSAPRQPHRPARIGSDPALNFKLAMMILVTIGMFGCMLLMLYAVFG